MAGIIDMVTIIQSMNQHWIQNCDGEEIYEIWNLIIVSLKSWQTINELLKNNELQKKVVKYVITF